jgi:multidrug efflux pump
MKWTDIFIKRPVLSICINLLIIIGGYQAFQSLSIRQYPRIDSSAAIIKTAYVGASPELVRGFVTTPLERVLASVEGIDYIESESKLGLSTITVRLKLNYDTNAALSQIQSKISQVRNDLPPEAEIPTVTIENTDNRFASVYISFYSEQLEANQITDYLLRVVQPKLSSINGVQKAEILGARQFAVRVWLDSNKLAAHKLTASDIRLALQQNNYLSAVGTSKGELIQINLRANTDLTKIEEFRNIPVKQTEDGIVRLNDVADVQMGAENYDQDVRFSGQQATFMGVWVLPTANSLDVINAVRKELPELERNLPGDLKIAIPYDSTGYIRDALKEVFKTLAETIVIVIVVIFLFIGSFRAVIVPIVAIPLSLIGALMLMYLAGFTINLLTLLGIVLAVGLVVDDAIVMLENIERNIRAGLKPFEAAIQGARELITPVISMTITLAAVYLPVALQAGLTGALFREFALSLAGAVFISGFVALTLAPMMCSRILVEHESSRYKDASDRFFARLDLAYENSLKKFFLQKLLLF